MEELRPYVPRGVSGDIEDLAEKYQVREKALDATIDEDFLNKQPVTLYHKTGSLFFNGIQEHGLNPEKIDEGFASIITTTIDLLSKYQAHPECKGAYNSFNDRKPLAKKQISMSTGKDNEAAVANGFPVVLYEELNPRNIRHKHLLLEALTSDEQDSLLQIYQYADRIREVNETIELSTTVPLGFLRGKGILQSRKELISALASEMTLDRLEDMSAWYTTARGLRHSLVIPNTEIRVDSIAAENLYLNGRRISTLPKKESISGFLVEDPKGSLSDYLEKVTSFTLSDIKNGAK